MTSSDPITPPERQIETENAEWAGMNPLYLEQSIRDHLKGITLVGELNLSPDSELYLQSRSVIQRASRNGQLDSLATIYPAALVIFLVAEGIYRYRGGAYWDQLSIVPALQMNQTTKVGQSFLTSLEKLSLETFASVQHEENALRFVMPILLHGGIPHYSAPDLWRLLLSEMDNGLDEADQVLAKWNKSRSALVALDKPVQRFLRHGGSFAVDLLQRMIDLIEYAGELGRDQLLSEGSTALATYAGVPTYLAATLLEAGEIRRARGRHLPRPHVKLDPYSGEGPTMVLPPFSGANQEERWFLRWGSDSDSLPTSRVEEREFPLEPADQWTVALGSTGREWSRSGVGGLKVFFFDPRTGELLVDQKRIKASSVLALAHRSIEFLQSSTDDPIGVLEELPETMGPWSGWVLHALNLIAVRGFRIRIIGDESTRLINVSTLGEQPSLLEAPIEGVTDGLGRSVFSKVPSLVVDTSTVSADSWSVRFRFDDGVIIEQSLDTLPCMDTSYNLGDLFEFRNSPISGDLLVRGPLGSDFRTRFVVIYGLDLTQLDEVIHPEKEVSIAATAPGFKLNGSVDSTILSFPAKQDVQPLTIASGENEIELRVTIPRILWFVRTNDGISRTFDSKTETLALRDLEKGVIDALLVRARREAMVQLHLLVDGKPRQSTGYHDTVGSEGRWTFSLREFATTAAHSGKSKLDFRLDVDSIELTPLTVFMEHEVTHIKVESLVDNQEASTLCQIEWRENRVFEDRSMWLWSEHRPWSDPFRHPIDDSASGSTEIFVPHSSLPPGPYLLEIGLHDPWVQRPRPSLSARNVARATLGHPSDVRPYLKSLNNDVPLECLELVLAGSEAGSTMQTFGPRLSSISHQIGAALAAIIDERREGASSHPVARELFHIICLFPDVLLSGLEDIDRLGTSEDVTRFMIAIIPDLISREVREFPGEIHERIWRISMLAGAATDLEFSPEANDRWERYTGWSPGMRSLGSPDEGEAGDGMQALPFLGSPIDRLLASLPTEQLDGIIEVLVADLKMDEMLIFQGGTFQQIGLRLLKTASGRDVESLINWRSRYGQMNEFRARSNPLLETALDRVAHVDSAPAWTTFLQDLLAASIHLITIPNSRPIATMALIDALPISSELVTRNLLLAMLFTHLNEGTS